MIPKAPFISFTLDKTVELLESIVDRRKAIYKKGLPFQYCEI